MKWNMLNKDTYQIRLVEATGTYELIYPNHKIYPILDKAVDVTIRQSRAYYHKGNVQMFSINEYTNAITCVINTVEEEIYPLIIIYPCLDDHDEPILRAYYWLPLGAINQWVEEHGPLATFYPEIWDPIR